MLSTWQLNIVIAIAHAHMYVRSSGSSRAAVDSECGGGSMPPALTRSAPSQWSWRKFSDCVSPSWWRPPAGIHGWSELYDCCACVLLWSVFLCLLFVCVCLSVVYTYTHAGESHDQSINQSIESTSRIIILAFIRVSVGNYFLHSN